MDLRDCGFKEDSDNKEILRSWINATKLASEQAEYYREILEETGRILIIANETDVYVSNDGVIDGKVVVSKIPEVLTRILINKGSNDG